MSMIYVELYYVFVTITVTLILLIGGWKLFKFNHLNWACYTLSTNYSSPNLDSSYLRVLIGVLTTIIMSMVESEIDIIAFTNCY